MDKVWQGTARMARCGKIHDWRGTWCGMNAPWIGVDEPIARRGMYLEYGTVRLYSVGWDGMGWCGKGYD